MNRKKILTAIVVIAMIAFVTIGISSLRTQHDKLELNKVQLQDRSTQIKQLELKYNTLNKNLDNELKSGSNDQQKIQQLEQEKQQLEQQKQDLESQLQAKLEAKSKIALAANTIVNTVTATASASAAPLPTNDAKAYIYSHESGNRTDAINAGSGACGLGQALPCSKMPCSLSDYGCQDAYFTQYAVSRYGSWEAAAAFWQAHSWW